MVVEGEQESRRQRNWLNTSTCTLEKYRGHKTSTLLTDIYIPVGGRRRKHPPNNGPRALSWGAGVRSTLRSWLYHLPGEPDQVLSSP